MNVAELIELLEELDQDAEVLIMSQENWPFELAITGVTTREDLGEEVDGGTGGEASDVFIVDGEQLRYGNKSAWKIAAS
jgi:hypothetical protein